MKNPVAKHFQKFNKNRVETDRKKEQKKNGIAVDKDEAMWEDADIDEQEEDNG